MTRAPKRGGVALATGGGEAESPTRKKAQYTLDVRHIEALRAEAFRRAAERRTGDPDASEVLREVLDAWIAKGGKR